MKNQLPRVLMTILFFLPFYLFSQTNPSTLPGLKLWLDASDINNGSANPADGTNINTWLDKSGNANNATVYPGQNAGKVYASQINAKAVVRFARTSQVLGSVYQVAGVDIRATVNASVTIFTVYKQGAQSGDQALWGNDNGGWDRFFFTSWSSNVSAGANNGGASLGPSNPAAIVTGAGVVGTTKLLTAVYSNGVANGSAIYFNGQTITSFTDNTNATDAQTSFRLGFDGDDNCFNGDVAEVIVYNRVLTGCEIQQLNRYLGNKYGIVFSTVNINTGGPTTLYEGGSVVLTASTTGTAYKWLKDGVVISGATNQSYTAAAAGNYQVAVTNSCTDTSAATAVTMSTMTAPGNALYFDGSNDYVKINANSNFDFTTGTVECWVRPNGLIGNACILANRNDPAGARYSFHMSTTAIGLYNGTIFNGTPFNSVAGRWYHLAFVCTPGSTDVYVNGTKIGTLPSGPGTATGLPLYIGYSSAGEPFAGSMDEIRIWNAARTQSQIQDNMYNIINPATAGLVGYYRFDNAGTTQLYDFTGSGRDGTLNNFALSGSTSNWVASYALVVPTQLTTSSVRGNHFVASWTAPAVGSFTNYLLDVSTNASFSSFVAGYNGLNVGTATSYDVTGLTNNTTYYYRLRADLTALAGQGAFSMPASVTTSLLLPVTLNSFSAISQDANTVLLAWTTTSEINFSYFTIERSYDGSAFTAVGKVSAKGNAGLASDYAYSDNPSGTPVYYRLKMVDLDGDTKYSNVLKAGKNSDSPVVVILTNAARGSVTVKGLSGGKSLIQLIDVSGQVLQQQTTSSRETALSVAGFARGTYYVRITDGAKSFIKGFIKP